MEIKVSANWQSAGIAFCIVAFIFVGDATASKEGLVFLNSKWDIGKVTSLKKQTHTFSFINNGKKSVTIDKVLSSCGCTAVVASDKKTFLPGERGEVLVTFNPVGHFGKLETAVRVYTDDLDAPPIKLYLTGDLPKAKKGPIAIKFPPPVISVVPTKVKLGKLKKGQTVIYNIKVYNRGESDLQITNFDAMSDKGNQSLRKKMIKKGKGIELTAFYKASNLGKFKDYLVIRSNDPKNHTIRLEITGIVE